jgi:rhodanese-related sulfurtransferase
MDVVLAAGVASSVDPSCAHDRDGAEQRVRMKGAIQPESISAVGRFPAATPDVAAVHFLSRLAFETDVTDVHADLEAGVGTVVVVDSRTEQAWQHGHVPGAVHLPTADIARLGRQRVPRGSLVVTYCWGPGCNGATRAAFAFAQLGFAVKEMLGGYEYWVRQGLPVSRQGATFRGVVDELTAAGERHCDCQWAIRSGRRAA